MEQSIAHITFWTKCHPEADGREAQPGERMYEFTFPLDDGRILAVQMGEHGLRVFQDQLRQLAVDDALENALKREK